MERTKIMWSPESDSQMSSTGFANEEGVDGPL